MADEPDLSSSHTFIFVRHQGMGLVKRIFPEDEDGDGILLDRKFSESS